MNSSAMGLALAGKRIVLIHVRIDFLASGMCALVNHIPIWNKKGVKLPLTIVCQVGKGMGQGAQHSKDLSGWFVNFEGWNVVIPKSAEEAAAQLRQSVLGDQPVLYVLHRELFEKSSDCNIPSPSTSIRLCGASQTHEKEFYGSRFVSGPSRIKPSVDKRP
jgi:pyruvate/2-oxoglutarate/acetoin dehydrogenase E1 component